MRHFLDFEKPIANLEGKVEELRHMSTDGSINIADEIGKLQTRIERELNRPMKSLAHGKRCRLPAILTGLKSAPFSTGFLMISPRLPVIVIFLKITRSLAAWRGSVASR